MRKMIKKTVLFLSVSLFLTGNPLVLEAKTPQNVIENTSPVQTPRQHKTSSKNRKLIKQAVAFIKSDGEKAAACLNKIRNQYDFEAGLRKVLNQYYSMEKEERGELKAFTRTVDDSAATIVKHYTEAARERENGKNLDYQVGEAVVSFYSGTSQKEIDRIMQETAAGYEIVDSGEVTIAEDLPEYKKKRLEKIKDLKTDIVILAKINLEDTVERAKEKFKCYDCVADASENTFLEADGTVETSYGSITTNDPYFNGMDQWHLKNINVSGAYQSLKREESLMEIWVAVIDCGVQMNHPDLNGKLLTTFSVDVTQGNMRLTDCADKRSNYGQYTANHGTMIAGVIAAKANNGIFGAGIASIADDEASGREVCKIMAIKCDNTVDYDRHITKSYLANAINFAVSHGAEVINISYSTKKKRFKPTEFRNLENAIKRAVSAGVCVVASAGNDGSERLRYPAAFEGVIGVGATLSNNEIAPYSNQSAAVDIVAPGGQRGKKIFSIRPVRGNRGGYGYGRGTSYSAPQVAATVALMKSVNYNLTPEQILTQLKKSASVTVRGKRNSSSRFPLLNTGRAVFMAKHRGRTLRSNKHYH
ncbi:S8 family serine peptidase [Lachnospiraceae bacterium 45-W7]